MNHWWHIDRTGDKEHVVKKGKVNAIYGSDAQVENGPAAQRIEERPESDESKAGSGDYAEREESSET